MMYVLDVQTLHSFDVLEYPGPGLFLESIIQLIYTSKDAFKWWKIVTKN